MPACRSSQRIDTFDSLARLTCMHCFATHFEKLPAYSNLKTHVFTQAKIVITITDSLVIRFQIPGELA